MRTPVSCFPMSAIEVSSERWSRKRIAKAILLLGIPLIVGELGSIVQQYADTIMVGHYGTNHLAAAGFVNTIFYFVIFLTLGMSYAITPLVGNAYGRKDYKEAYRIFREGVRTNLLVGIFFVSIMLLVYFNLEKLFFSPTLLGKYHQPAEILELSKGYWLILTSSIPFLTGFYARKQFLDGIGKTTVSMWILLVSNLLNIGLNWCLIFGHCGFRPLGLYGAGIATLASRVVQFVLIIIAVRKSSIFKEYYHSINPSWAGVWKQIRLGIPVSLQLGLEIGMFNVCGIFMGWFGAAQLAAHQAMYTISTLFFQVLYGMGAAGAILISQFHSIKAWSNIGRTARMSFLVGLLFITVTSLFVLAFFDNLASAFTEDSAVINIMKLILPSLLLYQFGDCLQISFANALRGLESTKPLAIITVFTYVFVCMPLCYLFAFVLNWGEKGVWAGIPIGLFLAGVLFRRSFRIKLKSLTIS